MKKRWYILILGLIAGIFIIGVNMFANENRQKPVAVTSHVVENKGDILSGQWDYMPGITKTPDGYVVHPIDLAIDAQDGSSAVSNPPVNLAGTHLEKVTGDFVITTTIRPMDSSSASVQLYGKVPIIADEFRIERESIRITVAGDQLKINVWDGSGKKTAVQVSHFTPQQVDTITMKRQGKTIRFIVNDVQVGSIDDAGTFDSQQVWFGVDAAGGKWQLSDLDAQKLDNGKFEIVDASSVRVTQHDQSGLQFRAARKRPGFLVGSAMALGPVTSDPDYAAIALDKQMFGSMTPENLMKMINLQPQRGVYTFEQADALVKIAKQNGLTIHGHTLVFGEANPPWFTALPVRTAEDKQQIARVMEDHIATVITHFGHDVTSWDVINEPLADYDDFDSENGNVLRNHKWYQALGENYILKALKTAHQANPDAMLFINEYGLEQDGERWDAFIELLKRLKPQLQANDIPLTKIGIGFQAHVYESKDRIDVETLRRHIRQLEKLGYSMQISEMDVYADDGEGVQANQYADVFTTCLNEENCVAWSVWILSDRYNFWKDEDGTIQQGEDGLYNKNMRPQLAVKRLQSQ